LNNEIADNNEIIDRENREKIMKENPDYEFIGEFIEVSEGEFLAVAESRTGDGKDERHEQFHIHLDGTKAYKRTFVYVAPFNKKERNKEWRALVREDEETFFIIDPKGERVYPL